MTYRITRILITGKIANTSVVIVLIIKRIFETFQTIPKTNRLLFNIEESILSLFNIRQLPFCLSFNHHNKSSKCFNSCFSTTPFTLKHPGA